MSSLGPAKVKAYLSGIKEAFLDNPSESSTLTAAFLGLLKIELLLRGVLVEDDEKIWSQIQSSVGKSLLVEQPSKLPKPLLAGANIVAGRVAEAFYTKLKNQISLQVDKGNGGANSFECVKNLIPSEKSQGARQRAEDLQDERWLFLLSSNFSSNYDHETGVKNYANGVLQIAIGYYSTATSIQTDTPQMWKKLWDAWSLFQTDSADCDPNDDRPPHEAQLAIENLIRIALARGNTKRASELQLRLVQSYLNPKPVSCVLLLSVLPKKKRTDITGDTTIAQSFGESFTRTLPSSQKSPKADTVSVEKARLTLEACQSYFENPTQPVDSESILYRTLRVETLLAEENARVKSEASEMEKRSTSKTSFADCITQCRTALIVSSYNKTDKMFLEHAKILRDTMIEAWGSVSGEGLQDLSLCFQWVSQSILRLEERAEVIGRKKSSYQEPWNEVLQFILPILREMDRQIGHTMQDSVDGDESKSVISLSLEWLNGIKDSCGKECAATDVIETVVSTFPTVLSMMCGDGNPTIPVLDKELNLVVSILSALVKRQELRNSSQQKKDAPSVGTSENGSLRSIQKWKNARASGLCLLCQDNASSIQQITNDAVGNRKKEKQRGLVALFQCLVAWSGWFQNPWPYCTNLADARRLLASAELCLSRPMSPLEQVLLQLAKADAEFLNGGFVERAYDCYSKVLETLDSNEELTMDSNSLILLRAHCYNGMTRAQHANQDFVGLDNDESSFSEKSLQLLEDLTLSPVIPSLWIWHRRPTFEASKAYQLSASRQLIANSLVHFGQFEKARSFLEKGVTDSPLDADAALALGAFQLRVTFYIEKSTEGRKEAQVNLLKAAKLDPSRSNPFALLGIWYEATGDLRRAEGCFRKSLKLDPCNPIAGRGLLRLCLNSDCQDILNVAINRSSPLNGWAWNAVGLGKAYGEGDDSLAVVAILKGLRCRDVALSDKENLGVFYATPSSNQKPNELSAALAEVGMCYRRLGRMTSSIRAFHASIEASDVTSVPHTTLIACAQVEQELGLFDEAAARFSSVVDRGESTSRSVALHGQAMALFSIAERELLDGKIGTAFMYVERAIDSCQTSSMSSACQFKLLGDLYSFGASFPADIFFGSESENEDLESCLQNQLSFVSKGEAAYRSALSAQAPFFATADDESIAIKSSALCDIALNMLLQAQLLSSKQVSIEKIDDKYELAAKAFRDAIEYNPIHAASWCGLGCSSLKTDPLLAQHAFCRCIQIENTFSDAYANVGFLYTSGLALTASKSTMEALTQVADTPMMWMNCAFILEREAEKHLQREQGKETEECISQAADAYRASLQVNRHPEAQFGLSLTGRMKYSEEHKSDISLSRSFERSRKDCFSYMNEYIGASLQNGGSAPVFQGVMSIEMGENVPSDRSWRQDINTRGKKAAKSLNASETDSLVRGLKTSTDSLLAGEGKEQPETLPSPKEETIQRQLWFDPDRGDLWLSLAKTFVEKDSVESAKTASARAADILSQSLVAPSQKSPSFVDAKMISEATSLKCWLNGLESTSSSNYDMQRALMMDPTNLVARQSICHQ